jgi:hypothetical protein
MLEAGKLVPEGEVLNDEVRSIPEDGDDQRDGRREMERHGDDGSLGSAEVGNGQLHPIPEDGDDQRDGRREMERHGDDGSLGSAEVGNAQLHPRSE